MKLFQTVLLYIPGGAVYGGRLKQEVHCHGHHEKGRYNGIEYKAFSPCTFENECKAHIQGHSSHRTAGILQPLQIRHEPARHSPQYVRQEEHSSDAFQLFSILSFVYTHLTAKVVINRVFVVTLQQETISQHHGNYQRRR